MIQRFPIIDVAPVVHFGGQLVGVKAIPGERIEVTATIIREGHDALGAQVVLFDPSGALVSRTSMHEIWPNSDRWSAHIAPTTLGLWQFAIESFDAPYQTWEHDAGIKIPAVQDVELCIDMGIELFTQAIAESKGNVTNDEATMLATALKALQDKTLAPIDRFNLATTAAIREYFHRNPLRRYVCISEKFPISVEPERTLFSSWYEFFPRSEGAKKNSDGTITSGNFATAQKRLPYVAQMGFDILYLPPIHPIGKNFRKGKNNSLTAGPNDPGVPWAIGSTAGGHDAINPELGTITDFDNFVRAAQELGIDVAMDLALQASPDHPWVTQHPEWFTTRLDGSIAYAENPPKKYQDIYPLNFDNDYEGLLEEVLRIIRFWMSHGIKTFRVDNPHTKPVHFWQEVIAIITSEKPDVIFLAEAFTRPSMMHALGKAGFQQSYTYFTWRVHKHELIEYGNEVAKGTAHFFRPNFWVNTPDILPFHLQSGNPAVFALRAVLASTMSASWGMYAGYELYEHITLREGAEEYRDSEKYEIKLRDWALAEKTGMTLAPFIGKLNEIRKKNPALQRLRNLEFHHTDSDQILAYSKREGENLVLVVVNLDSTRAQETTVHWNLEALGLGDDLFDVTDQIDGAKYRWSPHTFVRLDPARPVGRVAHICTVTLERQ